MKFFDRLDPTDLDRREWHLWLLTITVVSILFIGIALLMYPSTLSGPVILAGNVRRTAFFGFCALALLLLGYLVDRQIMIRTLRRQIEEERQVSLRVRQAASADLLQGLPGPGHFHDRLIMEHRRAVSAGQPMSLVLVALTPGPGLDDAEISIAFGDAAKALLNKLRGDDSVFLVSPGTFCVLLPGVQQSNADRVSERLREGLQDASGVSGRFSFNLQVLSYPDDVQSAREMEEVIGPFLRAAAPPARFTAGASSSIRDVG